MRSFYLMITIFSLSILSNAQGDFNYFEDYINSSWKSSGIEEPGWFEKYFDDSHWGYAVAERSFPPWCWFIHPDSSQPYTNCYFRRVVTTGIFSVQSATQVFIKLFADDDYELYVNGNLIGTDLSGVAGPIDIYDITSNWSDGDNVVAIKAINTIAGGRMFGVVRYYFDVQTNSSSETFKSFNNYRLEQNYPNPFNPATTIEYELQESGNVEINVYDELGQIVINLFNAHQSKGMHKIMWDGKNNNGDVVSSGRYFYQIIKNDFIQTKKMV